MSANKYYDIPRRNGKDNMGGFSCVAWIAPTGAFTTIKGIKTTTDPGDKVTIDGAHVFPVGKGMIKVYSTLDTAKLATEIIGERGGHAAKITGELFTPGMSKLNAELARNCPNDEWLIFLKDVNSSTKFIQVGTEDLPATLLPKFDSATISSGKKGFTFTFEAFGHGLLFYETDPNTQLDETFASSGGLEDAETYVN